ncbi:MAG: hypothetical protein WBG50_24780 [Desulfomonilaceae bacterium]
MENPRPQYIRPVIVDLDEPDGLYASGACGIGSGAAGSCNSSGIGATGGTCKATGWVNAQKCNTGNFCNDCSSGGFGG